MMLRHLTATRSRPLPFACVLRRLLFQNERRGLCMYWGYQQRSTAWNSFVSHLSAWSDDEAAAEPPLRVCMEAHSHIDYGVPWQTRFEQLLALREKLRHRLKLLLLLRLREPLSHYISYYLWTVAERQQRSPQRFGRSFEEWARRVPNLQTEVLLSSKHAFTASFAPVGHSDLRGWRERWGTPNRTAARRRLALRVVSSYDVLGTTKRFAETSLLVARALNWTAYDAAPPPDKANAAPEPAETCMRRNVAQPDRMWWCRVPGRPPAEERRRVHARVCPNTTKCRQLIRELAPVDHEIYALAKSRLDAAVAAADSNFARDLELVKRVSRQGARQRRDRCAWRPMNPYVIGSPRLDANNRQRVWEVAPNFSTPEGACVTGPNKLMKLVWSEHRQGGRIANGWPMLNLVPAPSARQRRRPPRALQLQALEKIAMEGRRDAHINGRAPYARKGRGRGALPSSSPDPEARRHATRGRRGGAGSDPPTMPSRGVRGGRGRGRAGYSRHMLSSAAPTTVSKSLGS
jgi:hypothetical protein